MIQVNEAIEMVEKKENKAITGEQSPETADAGKLTRKTAAASDIQTVQMKKKLPVKKPVAAKESTLIRSRKVKAAPSKNIGIPTEPPVKRCEDRFCPYHGKLSARGIILDVQLVSKRMQGTVVVKRERRHYIKKYQRYEKRTSRYLAHMPACLEFEIGDMVRIAECRPLSKATSFVVIGRV